MVLYSIKLRSEQAPRHGETGHDDGHHRHELDEDVQARAGSVLERVAHSVAHHGGAVYLAALATEVTFFDILFGIVPRTAGIRHKDSKYESAAKSADKQSQHTGNTEDKSGQMGAMIAISEGTTISRCAPFVEMATQRS
mgnify:CR=1 FL=1